MRWDIGWTTPATLAQAIERASACVFPYLPEFGRHAGASAALAQALTHAVPLIVSTELRDQAPPSEACFVIPPGEVKPLRRAIDHAMARVVELRAAAIEHVRFALTEHTYEGHLDRVVERMSDLAGGIR